MSPDQALTTSAHLRYPLEMVPAAHPSDLDARFAAADAQIERRPSAPLSLDPSPRRATKLKTLREALEGDARDRDAFSEALVSIAESQLRHFPGNLFWDFDAFAAQLVRFNREELREAVALSQSLMERFGMNSPIRFRYVHDFIYGFDWARWVAQDPEARSSVPPFGLDFLRYIFGRGGELIEAIRAKNDARYPPLGSNEGARNPFEFIREPREEYRLMRALASRELIPVRAYELGARGEFRHDFRALRGEVARELGLTRLP